MANSNSGDTTIGIDAPDETAQPSNEDRASQQKRIENRIAVVIKMQQEYAEVGEAKDNEDDIRFNHQLISLRSKLAASKPPDVRRNDLQKKLKHKQAYVKSRTEHLDTR